MSNRDGIVHLQNSLQYLQEGDPVPQLFGRELAVAAHVHAALSATTISATTSTTMVTNRRAAWRISNVEVRLSLSDIHKWDELLISSACADDLEGRPA